MTIIAIILVLLLSGAVAWLWWSNRQLAKELNADRIARTMALQDEADIKIKQASETAEAILRDAIAKLNREVVRVDPNDPNLADAFDRATGGDDD